MSQQTFLRLLRSSFFVRGFSTFIVRTQRDVFCGIELIIARVTKLLGLLNK